MLLQKRKRKEKEDDTVSLSSFDLKVRVREASCLFVGWLSTVAPLNVSSQQTLILLRDSGTCHTSVLVRVRAQHNPTISRSGWHKFLF